MTESKIPSKSHRRKRTPEGSFDSARVMTVVIRLFVAIAFVTAIYFSGRLGVEMARDRLPDSENPSIPSSADLTLGNAGDPIFLAQSPETLRRFFSDNSTPEQRARADLSQLGIRRLSGSVSMTTIRAEADAVQVEITSGAIAGTVYWIHHSQMPDPSTFDAILSPVPE